VLGGLGRQAEWLGSTLRYWYTCSAVRPHPNTGELVWCNQASVSHGSYYLHLPTTTELGYTEPELAPSHTTHWDGSPLSRVQLAGIRQAQWDCSRAVAWQAGDLLLLDNSAVAHARLGFPPQSSRSLVVALTH